MINSLDAEYIDRECTRKDGLFYKMYIRLLEQIDNVKKDFGLDDDDAIMHKSVFTMYDTIEGIRVISEGLNTVNELRDKINIVFEGDESDAIRLSTVHKAKGLEADNVYIYLPSLMPIRYARKDWEIKTEKNLIYVAYTRAKKTLNFIKEGEYPYSNGGSSFDLHDMKSSINIIRGLVDYEPKALK